MGRRAREAYEQRFSAEVNYRELAQVYRDAIVHRRARGGDPDGAAETGAGRTATTRG
jgi:hypothetical protein